MAGIAGSPPPDEANPFTSVEHAKQLLLEEVQKKNRLIRNRKYDTADWVEWSAVEKAFDYMVKKHAGAKRGQGYDYWTHPAAVALKLAKIGAKQDEIIAGLLHDVHEDTDTPLPQIKFYFGHRVAKLVDLNSKKVNGVIKPQFAAGSDEEIEQKFLQSILESRDLGAILIKAIDIAHNLNTLEGLDERRRIRYLKNHVFFFKVLHKLGLDDDVRAALQAYSSEGLVSDYAPPDRGPPVVMCPSAIWRTQKYGRA